MTSFQKFHFSRIVAALFVSLALLGALPCSAFAADAKIIEAAKKEGELAWWSTIAQDQSQKIVDEFMKLYPFIKASYWRSGSVGIAQQDLDRSSGRSFELGCGIADHAGIYF